MKACDYCGRQNEPDAPRCYECGSTLAQPVPEAEPGLDPVAAQRAQEAQLALEPEEIPFGPLRAGRATNSCCAAARPVGMGCGAFPVPGLLIFAWLLTSYQSRGYKRMAKEFKLWFGLGVAAWVLVILLSMVIVLVSE